MIVEVSSGLLSHMPADGETGGGSVRGLDRVESRNEVEVGGRLCARQFERHTKCTSAPRPLYSQGCFPPSERGWG